MEVIKRISVQKIPDITPDRWRILVDLKIDPMTGDVLGKPVGELIRDGQGFRCILKIEDADVRSQQYDSYGDALTVFCIWVQALIDKGLISKDPLKRLS